MKKRLSMMKILLVLIMIAGQMGVYSSVNAEGEPDGPNALPPVENGWVQVSTKEQLVYINQNQELYLTENISLTADIDLTGIDWIPFGGNDYVPFSGTFDGQGHWITGLEINNDTRLSNGFFGQANGRIQYINLRADIKGGSNAGALVGFQSGGSIDHVYTEGTVRSGHIYKSVTPTGGIVGLLSNARLSHSSSAAFVTVGESDNLHGGGLIGSQAMGSISDSYFTGNLANEPVKDHPTSHIYAGGIVGYQLSSSEEYNILKNTYSTGAISTLNPRSYSSWGAIGGYVYKTNITDTYYDTMTSGMTVGASDPYQSTIEIYGKTTTEMKQQATYTGWDFTDTWNIHPAINNGYPYLRPAILTTALPQAVQNESYSMDLAGYDGACAGLTWTASGLPQGLSLSPSGELGGTPTQSGTYTVNLSLLDGGSATTERVLQLVVVTKAPGIADASVQPGLEVGATSITAAPTQTGHSFAYMLDRTDSTPPSVGDALPEGAVTYISGADIPGTSPGQAVDLFEVTEDENTGKYLIQAWQRFTLEQKHIRQFVPVNSLHLEPSQLDLTSGGPSAKLTAIIDPEDTTNKTIHWSSSNEAVATVDMLGEVQPVTAGTAIITVTSEDGSHTATATITVFPQAGTVTGSVYGTGMTPLEGVSVSVDSISILTDSQGHFTLEQIPAGIRTLVVRAKGYDTTERSVEVLAEQAVDTGMITLKPLATSQPEPQPSPGTTPAPSPASGSESFSGFPNVLPPTEDPATVKLEINSLDIKSTASTEIAPDGQTVIRLKPDTASLMQAFSGAELGILIRFSTESPVVFLDLPGELLRSMMQKQPEISVTFEVNGASYELPLNMLPPLADNTVVTIGIGKASPNIVSTLIAAVTKRGFELIGTPMDFTLYIDGKQTERLNQGYSKRILPLPSQADSEKSTAVWIDAEDQMHFVPSLFTNDDKQAQAIISTTHNSMFAVVSANHAFADMKDHWGRSDVEMLANKFIVEGVNNDTFSPENPVTRAEFAALLVRSLGLPEHLPTSVFADIPSAQWYAGAVGTAQAAGLINGYGDGLFRPEASITREQMAVILVRALDFARLKPQPNKDVLDVLADHTTLSAWASESVSILLEAGLMQGKPTNRFSPKEMATRAQSAAVLNRLLQYMRFIDSPQ
ncbi:S-layer homology domain-containing protein [Paenibacillus sp. FSL R5-0623]|uniref:S-layer homology domain-containing protein n=1 Tax=Paenibacillus sp. FSL R5-0623 TaxID=2921651 RepID=UPI0030DD17A1